MSNLDHLIYIIISLSLSGSFMTLLLFAGRPFFKKKLSKAFAYYIWLLVLIRLTVPFSTQDSMMNLLFQELIPTTTMDELIGSSIDSNIIQENELHTNKKSNGSSVNRSSNHNQSQIAISINLTFTDVMKDVIYSWRSILTVIWLVGFIVSVLRFIIPYLYFKKKIIRANSEPDMEDVGVLNALYSRRNIQFKYNSYICTPMLLGIFSPCILIPGCDYVKNGSKVKLENILRHELVHYSHKDIIYKWLTVVITSIHWFNPLMIAIRRQISRSCELACDEAVIKDMSDIQKQSYGETLLSMASGKRLSQGIVAITLCEEKKELKERLMSIMKYKKGTSGMFVLAIVITVLFTGCGTLLGSAAKEDSENEASNIQKVANQSVEAVEGKTGTDSTQMKIENNSTDNNTDIPAESSVDESTETAESQRSEDIDTPEDKLLQETTDNFVKAYFSGDEETVKKYLSVNAEISDSYVYEDINGNEQNVYDKLLHLLAKWYGDSSGGKANVQYEYQLEGEDSYSYLGIILEYTADKWQITGYYLEK